MHHNIKWGLSYHDLRSELFINIWKMQEKRKMYSILFMSLKYLKVFAGKTRNWLFGKIYYIFHHINKQCVHNAPKIFMFHTNNF